MNKEHGTLPDLCRYWWEKGQRCLVTAGREYDAGNYDFAINRLYYCVFYAVSAWMIENGMSFRKHTGVRSAFHKHLIREGLMSRKWAKLYDRLFEDRTDGDYVPFTQFEDDYVCKQISDCREFLDQMKPLINAIR